MGRRPLKSLSLEALVDLRATMVGAVTEGRASEQCRYSLPDTLLSGFAMRVFQHPSLWPFQRAMHQKRRRCNLQTIFGVQEVPSETQLREIWDGGEGEGLRARLPQLWEKVRRAGWGGRFTTTLPSGQHQGTYSTVALEGSAYFRSTTVQCRQCLRQSDSKGRVQDSPRIGGATGVRAGSQQVLPLDGEEVRNATAASAPQDCEWTASKRGMARLRGEHPQLALSVSGDARYAHAPFVAQLQQLRQHDVLVAKPSAPPTLRAAGAAAGGTAQRQTGQGAAGSGARPRT